MSKKKQKNWLRARILTLLGVFVAARGVPRAPQERPKMAQISDQDWVPSARDGCGLLPLRVQDNSGGSGLLRLRLRDGSGLQNHFFKGSVDWRSHLNPKTIRKRSENDPKRSETPKKQKKRRKNHAKRSENDPKRSKNDPQTL